MYNVILDAQMFLPQVAENKRPDPGQHQLTSTEATRARVNKTCFLQ